MSHWLLWCTIAALLSVAVYVAYGSLGEPGYEWLFLLPASGALFIASSSIVWRYRHRTSILTILFYMVVRYGIVPGLQVWLEGYSDYYRMPSVETIRWAILLMVYELAAIWFFMEVFGRNLVDPEWMADFSKETDILPTPQWLVFFIVTVTGCFVFFAVPEIKYSYSFIVGGVANAQFAKAEGLLIGSEGSGPIMVFFQMVRFVIPIFLINFCAVCYSKRRSVVWVFFALVALLPNLLFIFKSSRQGILYFALPAFLLLPRLFFFHAKYIRYMLLSCTIIVIILVTLEKNISADEDPYESIDRASLSHTINAYGSTSRNVARAIEAAQGFSFVNPQMFFFDVTQNVPFLGRVIESENRELNMVYQYAQWMSRTDQIIPMIGQGNAHWSFLFSPIYSVFFIGLALYLDRLMVVSRNFPLSFVYCLGLIKMVEYPFLLNITIATAFVTTLWIPLLVVVLLNDRIRVGRD